MQHARARLRPAVSPCNPFFNAWQLRSSRPSTRKSSAGCWPSPRCPPAAPEPETQRSEASRRQRMPRSSCSPSATTTSRRSWTSSAPTCRDASWCVTCVTSQPRVPQPLPLLPNPTTPSRGLDHLPQGGVHQRHGQKAVSEAGCCVLQFLSFFFLCSGPLPGLCARRIV